MLRFSFVVLVILTASSAQAEGRGPIVIKQQAKAVKDQSRIACDPAQVAQKFSGQVRKAASCL